MSPKKLPKKIGNFGAFLSNMAKKSVKFSDSFVVTSEVECLRFPLIPSKKYFHANINTVFVKKVVRFFHSTLGKFYSLARTSFGGFNHTSVTGLQFLVWPDHRCGFFCFADL